jgi:tetratricopeptide (TPR) repeat protein
MPKIIKKKPVKKKTAQDTEEVKSAALHALDAIKGRQRQVIIIISIIAAIAIIFSAFTLYHSSQNKEARALEIEADSIYYSDKSNNSLPETEKWKKALELYKKAVDIKATPTALFSLGNCYYSLGDNENAIKYYNMFADKFSNDYVILPLVYQKLASAYFKTGKNDKGLETLANLAKIKNGSFRDTALSMEAKHYETLGDTVKAQEKYRALVSEFPNSPWSAEAAAKVSGNTKKDTATAEQAQPAAEPAKK